MLKSWSIENFKSIVNSGELQLAPVTVLAGLNSSGKSSLLQSILMISQTLSSPAADRPLLPNGPMVQLGIFEHILNDRSEVNTLTIGFELIREQGKQKNLSNILTIRSVKVTSIFSGSKDNGRSSSAIDASNIVIDRVFLNIKLEFLLANIKARHQELNLEIKRFANVEEEVHEFLKNVASNYRHLIPSVGKKNIYQGLIGINSENVQECLISLSHFLPDQMLGKFKLEERYKDVEEIIEQLNEMRKKLEKKRLSTDDHSMEDKWKNTINKLRSFSTLHPPDIENKSVEGLERMTGVQHSAILSFDWVAHFFTSKIRYLGPLRADPGTVQQQFAPTSELDEVGSKGEYAAVVYQANQLAQIDYYNPFSSQVEQTTLQEALDIWAQYLGVASQIRTERLNGVTWQVALKPDQKPRLLPEVGFGISQVLPILVMGLLAPREALLLIEQPELHLHPRVQARLGDFFMGLAKCGKQCLIETHSENLVSQLRYHIVQAGGQEKSDCMIYFVDQDETGASRFDPVEISPNGNILNWPDGFFDETMLQEDRITAASLKKRAGNAKKG